MQALTGLEHWVLLSAFQLATCNASGTISSLLAGYEQRRQIPGDRSCLTSWICRALCTKGLKPCPGLWTAGINQIPVFVNWGTPALHFPSFFLNLYMSIGETKLSQSLIFSLFKGFCPALMSHPYGKNYTHKNCFSHKPADEIWLLWFGVLMTHLDFLIGRICNTAEV